MTDEANYDYIQAIAKQEAKNQTLYTANPFTITLPYDNPLQEFFTTISAVGIVEGDTILVSLGTFLLTDENEAEFLDIRSINAVARTDVFDLTINFSMPTLGVIKLNWRKL